MLYYINLIDIHYFSTLYGGISNLRHTVTSISFSTPLVRERKVQVPVGAGLHERIPLMLVTVHAIRILLHYDTFKRYIYSILESSRRPVLWLRVGTETPVVGV